MRRGPDERGSATLLVMACAGMLLMLGAALAVVAAMVAAHRTAQAAADLAALAGAAAARDGADPCTAAASVAAANGASLTDCRADGTQVSVVVLAAGPHWLGQPHDLTARARAGPEEVVLSR